MSVTAWSFVLQYARAGIGALVFLLAARVLSLTEIGLFAAAYAPVRLAQGIHKAGITEAVVISDARPRVLNTLFVMSVGSGLVVLGMLAISTVFLVEPIASVLLVLAPIPAILSLAAVSEGILRKSMSLRALALRAAVSQVFAAGLALWMLFEGWGVWALVSFALLNAVVTSTLSIFLARWVPRGTFAWGHALPLLSKVIQIAGRDLTGSALMPCGQIVITAAFGLPAAGAFQIATKVLSTIDTLTLAPLRFVALPQLSKLVGSPEFLPNLRMRLTGSALLGVLIWSPVAFFTEAFLSVLIGDKAASASPMLQALIPLGLLAALTMPINQALTALGHTDLVLKRTLIAFACSGLFMLPTLALTSFHSTAALSFAGLVAFLWYIRRALSLLGLTQSKAAHP